MAGASGDVQSIALRLSLDLSQFLKPGVGFVSHILIIDDEDSLCEVLQAFLEKEGHSVEAATSAHGALDCLRQACPDVILLDVRMPGTNGLELLPQIKTLCNSLVVVITAIDDYRIADLLYELGADGYLTKPLHLADLSRTIRNLLCRRPSRSV